MINSILSLHYYQSGLVDMLNCFFTWHLADTLGLGLPFPIHLFGTSLFAGFIGIGGRLGTGYAREFPKKGVVARRDEVRLLVSPPRVCVCAYMYGSILSFPCFPLFFFLSFLLLPFLFSFSFLCCAKIVHICVPFCYPLFRFTHSCWKKIETPQK